MEEIIVLKEDWIVQGITIPKGYTVLLEDNRIMKVERNKKVFQKTDVIELDDDRIEIIREFD